LAMHQSMLLPPRPLMAFSGLKRRSSGVCGVCCVASIILITLTVDGRCVLPVPFSLRVTGAHQTIVCGM
jgi:hypothetical protein